MKPCQKLTRRSRQLLFVWGLRRRPTIALDQLQLLVKMDRKILKVNSLDDLKKLEPNAIKRKFVEVHNISRYANDRVSLEEKTIYEQQIDS